YYMKTKTIKPKYLACIWCGGDIPKDKPYAQYCSPKCKDEALGFCGLKECSCCNPIINSL
ncbi:MAG: hypothetical protein AABY22_05150, partial [Nanoarchaeota archaeon]